MTYLEPRTNCVKLQGPGALAEAAAVFGSLEVAVRVSLCYPLDSRYLSVCFDNLPPCVPFLPFKLKLSRIYDKSQCPDLLWLFPG